MTSVAACPSVVTGELSAALLSLAEGDAAALPLLTSAECARLTLAAEALDFRPARPVVGEGEKAVHQDFDICTVVPQDGPFGILADSLSDAVESTLRSMQPPPLSPPFRFNDRVLQRYAVGARGISPHRDHIRYQGLVAIVVLSGGGRFYLSPDRSGHPSREIVAPPGHAILMRAPGFAGRRTRPFHGLDRVDRRRLTVGLRYDARID